MSAFDLKASQSIEEIIHLAELGKLGENEADLYGIMNISEKLVKKYKTASNVDWQAEMRESAEEVQRAQAKLIEKIKEHNEDQENIEELDEQYDLWMAEEDLRTVVLLRKYFEKFCNFPLDNPALKWLWEKCVQS